MGRVHTNCIHTDVVHSRTCREYRAIMKNKGKSVCPGEFIPSNAYLAVATGHRPVSGPSPGPAPIGREANLGPEILNPSPVRAGGDYKRVVGLPAIVSNIFHTVIVSQWRS